MNDQLIVLFVVVIAMAVWILPAFARILGGPALASRVLGHEKRMLTWTVSRPFIWVGRLFAWIGRQIH